MVERNALPADQTVDSPLGVPELPVARGDSTRDIADGVKPQAGGIVDLTNPIDSGIAQKATTAKDIPGCCPCDMEIDCQSGCECNLCDSKSVQQSRARLLETIGPALSDASASKRFEEMMAGFEKRMGSTVERRVAVGQKSETVLQEAESAVTATYEHLANMVGANSEKSPFDKHQRARIAESFLYHAMNPENVNGGKMNTGGWAEPAYVVMMNNHPDKMARLIGEVATTGQFTDLTGKAHKMSTQELRLDRRDRGRGFDIARADRDGSQPSPAVYLLDAAVSRTVNREPSDGGTIPDMKNSMERTIGANPSIISSLSRRESREALARDGGALRTMPGHIGTWAFQKEGDNWVISRGDQYDNRDRVVGMVPASKLARWIESGDGLIGRSP